MIDKSILNIWWRSIYVDDTSIDIDDGTPSKREIRGAPKKPPDGSSYACYKLDDGKTASNYMTKSSTLGMAPLRLDSSGN